MDAERLIDHVYSLLTQSYEKSYGAGYRKPEFRVVLNHEQFNVLRSHVGKLPLSHQIFIGIDKSLMFGHIIKIQREPPYLEAVEGEVESENLKGERDGN